MRRDDHQEPVDPAPDQPAVGQRHQRRRVDEHVVERARASFEQRLEPRRVQQLVGASRCSARRQTERFNGRVRGDRRPGCTSRPMASARPGRPARRCRDTRATVGRCRSASTTSTRASRDCASAPARFSVVTVLPSPEPGAGDGDDLPPGLAAHALQRVAQPAILIGLERAGRDEADELSAGRAVLHWLITAALRGRSSAPSARCRWRRSASRRRSTPARPRRTPPRARGGAAGVAARRGAWECDGCGDRRHRGERLEFVHAVEGAVEPSAMTMAPSASAIEPDSPRISSHRRFGADGAHRRDRRVEHAELLDVLAMLEVSAARASS